MVSKKLFCLLVVTSALCAGDASSASSSLNHLLDEGITRLDAAAIGQALDGYVRLGQDVDISSVTNCVKNVYTRKLHRTRVLGGLFGLAGAATAAHGVSTFVPAYKKMLANNERIAWKGWAVGYIIGLLLPGQHQFLSAAGGARAVQDFTRRNFCHSGSQVPGIKRAIGGAVVTAGSALYYGIACMSLKKNVRAIAAAIEHVDGIKDEAARVAFNCEAERLRSFIAAN